ncbi:hypothetical protein PMY12_18575 [Clostridium tertium]|uniref:hypothetical protein n=1 Tax=Clostridium tertium TaxID=1559 RepID=UPI00232A9300|nr:hypothetical protein [Clostridium tertium]MDB1935265.1 hypothetical protein [Clostridium tertium]MDB1939015.1 hypothetical protein [Clostridium tertium]
MIDGLNLYCKNKINKEEIIKAIGIKESDILFINNVDEWINKKDENIVVEYNGVLDEEDDYPGYHYYGVTLFNCNIKNKFNSLKKLDIIVDFD